MATVLTELLDNFVKNHDNRQLLAIPLAILAVSLVILLVSFMSSGSPVDLGMEFQGGTQISVETTDSPAKLEEMYSSYDITDVRQAGSRVVMQFGVMDKEQQRQLENDITSRYSNVQIQQVGPIYGRDLQVQAVRALIISFIGMSLVAFLLFRTLIPSLAIILSAFSDIMIAAAFMKVAGIELSLGTLAALLMLIGYSVDSDILLTNRVLKRRGTIEEKISRAMQTGITMTTTTLAALAVMYIVSTYSYLVIPSFTQITLLSQISIVLIAGLIADMMNTWLLNTGILRWYVSKPELRGRYNR
ncbi:protein translocase subunit secF [Methanosarcina thermophila]|jgi:preprotein translocase subunit SecF|uniref:Protein-export membrane protein SecF n=3 Tax=Methanosarcina thermophila TaxID=2210 RepID=A0A1I6ZLR5_METTE|nr:protein translocase subunit SecF [Methanosarcina thermophila]ALK04955.1 MAG: preprotein translocase subunit SecF [Methanosarcina sp. 795]AKB13678.1 Protein-export membrane protein SecF [Methanosarcina thermophila TM-1]AKB15681.1 Protein-export membrane protein SecF [Methanosarcina thermophila CHTI-55]NLU57601.1 protein translocase subunit SecF [Methanosarcina thermophila]SFT63525.1 protein translocase subunit secF [Methanosarcina thermophila]